jgi:hypothetical protein
MYTELFGLCLVSPQRLEDEGRRGLEGAKGPTLRE